MNSAEKECIHIAFNQALFSKIIRLLKQFLKNKRDLSDLLKIAQYIIL